jgi:hypothetical protein
MILVTMLAAFSATSSRAQDDGFAFINYVAVDKSSYELGENVNITTSYSVFYLNTSTIYEGSLVSWSLNGSSHSIASWSYEPNGTHIRKLTFPLSPDTWNPDQSGETGTAMCSILLETETGHTDAPSLERNFTVIRAHQNCSLIRIDPPKPMANASSIVLSFRVYNRNDPSFGVGLNKIYCNVTNPKGQLIVLNQGTNSTSSGNFSISFSPDFACGEYGLCLLSLQNRKYREGRFNYTLTVGRSPIKTALNLTWDYAGSMYNSSGSYALEPVRTKARLICPINGTGISGQELTLSLLDASSSELICRSSAMTNSSGFASCSLTIPFEGRFILQVSYDGVYSVWASSLENASNMIRARARDLAFVELVGLPSNIILGQGYNVKYAILDSLLKTPVSNLNLTIEMDGLSLANGTTDGNGVAYFSIIPPSGTYDYAGNHTLLVESSPSVGRRIYNGIFWSKSLHCKIPTFTKLRVPPQQVFEGGELITITGELRSSNSTPLAHQNMTFMICADGEGTQAHIILKETDGQGKCALSLRLPESGTITVIASFDGSQMLNSSVDSCNVTVFPSFHERLSSSIPYATMATFCSIALLSIARRIKRKLKWDDLIIS